MTLSYRIGIDVGLRSIGFAAIAYGDQSEPIELLNAMSLIHDAGIDPAAAKQADTRRLTSGVARRTRRMYASRKQRLAKLDEFLRDNDIPIIDLDNSLDRQSWHSRALLAGAKVDDRLDMLRHLSISVRHMARHRGWRNPYSRVDSLLEAKPDSDGFTTVVSQLAHKYSIACTEGKTLAQLVVEADQPTVKLRGDGGLLSERLHQQDVANELLRIASCQELEPELTEGLLRHIFAAKSPKGSAATRVGRDPLDPRNFRAHRASLEFQEYRIISLLANVRVSENGQLRSFTVQERQNLFELLNNWTSKSDPTWNDVSTLLKIDRGNLRGTASSTDDGERVTSTPPINITNRVFATSAIVSFKQFWKKSDAAGKSALIAELSHAESSDENSPEGIAAATLIRSLSPDELQKVDELRIPDGRAAYSLSTLEALRDYQLHNDSDLTGARVAVFDVATGWTPPAAPIAEPTGNPAVDRVLKAVNRWLLLAEKRWGLPESINIEHVRDGFISAKMAKDIERNQSRRSQLNKELAEKLQQQHNLNGLPRRSERARFSAFQRQHGQCAYCGNAINLRSMEMDHIIPRAGVGSNNAQTNLLAVCRPCNQSKGKQPFALWARSNNRTESQSIQAAIARVSTWDFDARISQKDAKRFRDEVTSRLERVSDDEALDVRSIESVAWMANELRHRISGKFSSVDNLKVRVFRGSITAEARRAAGMDKKIVMIGGVGKKRLDRRHHAVDAAVVATLSDYVAQVLLERTNLRTAERLRGKADTTYGEWKEFTGASPQHQSQFQQWRRNMENVTALVQSGLDNDLIPVTENLRLKIGNGEAHEATIRAFRRESEFNERRQLSDELPPELIDRSATEAQWCALTRHPDFTWDHGLPADSTRKIRISGTEIDGRDELCFFGGKAAAISVRGGYAELGDSVHHARIYRMTGGKKPMFAMLRVYTVDLVKRAQGDLFSVDIPEQSISWRCAEPRLRKAVRENTAEYVTWVVAGDELEFDAMSAGKGAVAEIFDAFGPTTRWRVRGFYSPSKLRIRPAGLSGEGISSEMSENIHHLVAGRGWLPAVNIVFGGQPVQIRRRDAHGRIRVSSDSSQLPVSVQVS